MSSFVVPEWPRPVVSVVGGADLFPVRQVLCVAKNYADHTREMGDDPERSPPFFFRKPASSLVPGGGAVAYPPMTHNLHHEVELVAAIGTGGRDIPESQALSHVWGYAVGLDMTRRDLQHLAKDQGQPWDFAKGFDGAAPIGALTPAADCPDIATAGIRLTVNDLPRQIGRVSDMVWSLPEIIATMSRFITLVPGDLIFTGTPSGVGPVVEGDVLDARIDGLEPLRVTILGRDGAPGRDGAGSRLA